MKYQIIPVTPFQQNCSLIWCTKTNKAALIDPGGDIEKLYSAIDQHGVVVEKVILTHGHLDHVGAAGILSEALGIPIVGPHSDDAFWLEWLPKQATLFGLPAAKPFTPNRWLNDGDQVTVGTITLNVIHCPGHTPGHVVLFEQTEQILFAGDVLFKGSIGRTDFPRGNYDELIHSITNRILPLGDNVIVIPGHGEITSIGNERLNNPYLS